MLEELRQQADTSFMFEEEEPESNPIITTERHFLGMTPAQRFVVAFMLLVLTVLIGSFALMVTNRVILPLS